MKLEKDIGESIMKLSEHPAYQQGGKYYNWLMMQARKEGILSDDKYDSNANRF